MKTAFMLILKFYHKIVGISIQIFEKVRKSSVESIFSFASEIAICFYFSVVSASASFCRFSISERYSFIKFKRDGTGFSVFNVK